MDDLVAGAVRERLWAVVGASNDRSKFGNRIYRDLRAAGYRVYPVNPGAQTIEGDRAFATLADLPETPAVVDVVVPAPIGFKILDDSVAVGAGYFWLQPGAESARLIDAARESGLHVIHNRCAMVEKLNWHTTPDGAAVV